MGRAVMYILCLVITTVFAQLNEEFRLNQGAEEGSDYDSLSEGDMPPDSADNDPLGTTTYTNLLQLCNQNWNRDGIESLTQVKECAFESSSEGDVPLDGSYETKTGKKIRRQIQGPIDNQPETTTSRSRTRRPRPKFDIVENDRQQPEMKTEQNELGFDMLDPSMQTPNRRPRDQQDYVVEDRQQQPSTLKPKRTRKPKDQKGNLVGDEQPQHANMETAHVNFLFTFTMDKKKVRPGLYKNMDELPSTQAVPDKKKKKRGSHLDHLI